MLVRTFPFEPLDSLAKPTRYTDFQFFLCAEAIVHTENFIRRSINALQHSYIQVVWLVHLSFGFLNVADFKAFVPDSNFARARI